MLTLTESSDYIQKCIKSCKTEDQLNSCCNMVDNLVNRPENIANNDVIRAYFDIKINNKSKRMLWKQ